MKEFFGNIFSRKAKLPEQSIEVNENFDKWAINKKQSKVDVVRVKPIYNKPTDSIPVYFLAKVLVEGEEPRYALYENYGERILVFISPKEGQVYLPTNMNSVQIETIKSQIDLAARTLTKHDISIDSSFFEKNKPQDLIENHDFIIYLIPSQAEEEKVPFTKKVKYKVSDVTDIKKQFKNVDSKAIIEALEKTGGNVQEATEQIKSSTKEAKKVARKPKSAKVDKVEQPIVSLDSKPKKGRKPKQTSIII